MTANRTGVFHSTMNEPNDFQLYRDPTWKDRLETIAAFMLAMVGFAVVAYGIAHFLGLV